MILKQLYQWSAEVRLQMVGLSKPQAFVLALFSLGVAKTRQNAASKVSEGLWEVGKADSVERRLQRFLSNDLIGVKACCQAWTRWVLSALVGDQLDLLVDETKLGDWLSVMVIGLAYRKRCIPLVWCCYHQDNRPCGQVEMIRVLMNWIAEVLPVGRVPTLQADRGIGTSPALIRAVQAMGWYFLFRVQSTTRFRLPNGCSVALGSLVERGGTPWTGVGGVFKKAGWLTLTAHVIWKAAYDQPWCLVTNQPDLHASHYATRAWHEHGFEDLKSRGWQWQDSLVRQPDHAHRLMLVLALAYAWTLSIGTFLDHLDPSVRALVCRGKKRPRFGLFRRALRYLARSFAHPQPLCTQLLLIPPNPPPESVVS